MILPLRRLHRSAFAALALVLPAVLVSAWHVRRAPPVQELPPELLPGLPPDDGPTGDVLVYWVDPFPEDAAEPDGLPPDAVLAGTLRSGALARAMPPGKRALLFDLAHGEVIPGPVEETR